MENLTALPVEVLSLILSPLDYPTLSKVWLGGWTGPIKQVVASNYYWKQRIQHQLGHDLEESHPCWSLVHLYLASVDWKLDKLVTTACQLRQALRCLTGLFETRLLLRYTDQVPSVRALSQTIEVSYSTMTSLLIQHPAATFSDATGSVLEAAVKRGDPALVELLLADPRVDPSFRNNCALVNAALTGHYSIVKSLLACPGVNPGAGHNQAIRAAALNGNVAIVRTLLADHRVDPSVNNNEAIRVAAYKGNAEAVAALMSDPRVDPSDGYNDAMEQAIQGRHRRVIGLLATDPRVDTSKVPAWLID